MEENKIVIYQTEDGQTQIDVRLENDTVWLTQACKMFQLTFVSATIGLWMGHHGDLFLTNEARILNKCPAEMCSENGEKYWNKEVLYVFWCLWEQIFYDFWSFFKVLHHRERASTCLYFVVIQPFRWFVKLMCSNCSSCSSYFFDSVEVQFNLSFLI